MFNQIFLVDYVEIARTLIQNGADINARENTGSTPIFYAVSTGKIIDSSPFILYQNWFQNGNWLLFEFTFLKNKNELFFEILGDVDIVNLLIEKGADLGVRNNFAKTPREIALKHGFQRIARILRRAEQSLQTTAVPS